MGCNKSAVRVGPAMLPGKKRTVGKSCTQHQTRQSAWKRMVRFRQVKVGPTNQHLGGGDSPAYEAGAPQQPGSELYTDNKPPNGMELTKSQRAIKKAWGESNQAEAQILLELQELGIVNFHSSSSGALSFSVVEQAHNEEALPPRRLPARLARLDNVPAVPDSEKADKLEADMKAAVERRKRRQEALRERLCAHSRLGTHHQKTAAEAERALKQKAADKIASKEAAFQDNLDKQREARLERARAQSRAAEHAQEYVKEVEKTVKEKAADAIAKKQIRFEAHMQQQEAERMDRIRAKSRMEEHAKEVADGLIKESQEKTAETVAVKQNAVESNIERRERFRTQRVLLNQRHRDNIRKALARRIAEQEEQAEVDMDYEIETAQYSEEEDNFFEPELQWVI